jgi:hypothetical protein
LDPLDLKELLDLMANHLKVLLDLLVSLDVPEEKDVLVVLDLLDLQDKMEKKEVANIVQSLVLLLDILQRQVQKVVVIIK